MRFASAITNEPDARKAVQQLLDPLDERVTPGMVDLVFLFATGHYNDDLDEIIERIGAALPTSGLLGCTGEGTIGCGREIEREPSISLVAASLPEVNIRPFHLRQHDLQNAQSALDWERMVAVSPESKPVFVAFGDPFRFAVHDFIDGINEAYPGAALVGGIASFAREPGQNRLVVNGEIRDEGLVGVAMTGHLDVHTVVSQGCRPIGTPFIITKGEKNVIRDLGGRPALQQLHQVIINLSEEEEQLARQSLLIGRVIDEYRDSFSHGDFLIHNIIGVDRKSGAMAIAGHARVGATVQFHVRDAASADEDLRTLLQPHVGAETQGALLFGCNGRGTHMWPEPGHDAGVIRELLGDIPLAGFFCGGEFGPVGRKNFVHGFTASLALFREPAKQ